MKNKSLPKINLKKNSPSIHPMLKAMSIWKVVSEQIYDLLGEEIHTKWFSQLRPVIISDKVLIIEAPNYFASQWLNMHYQELINALLSVFDKKLSCFILSQSDKSHRTNVSWNWFSESSTSKIKSRDKKNDS